MKNWETITFFIIFTAAGSKAQEISENVADDEKNVQIEDQTDDNVANFTHRQFYFGGKQLLINFWYLVAEICKMAQIISNSCNNMLKNKGGGGLWRQNHFSNQKYNGKIGMPLKSFFEHFPGH